MSAYTMHQQEQQLIEACLKGDFHCIKSLINSNTDPNITSSQHHGSNLLHLLSSTPFSTLEMVDYIMTFNLDINALNGRGYSALVLATRHGLLPIVRHLIDVYDAHPIPIDCHNDSESNNINHNNTHNDYSLLHHASYVDNPDLIDYLIKLQLFDVNQVSTNDGLSPIWCSAQASNWGNVKQLLLHGANPLPLHPTANSTLIFYAVWHEEDDDGNNVNNHHGNPCAHTISLIDLLVDYGINIHAVDSENHSALLEAAHTGRLPLVQHLISKYQMDTTIINSNQQHILHYAIASDNISLVQYILNSKFILYHVPIDDDEDENDDHKVNIGNNYCHDNNNNNTDSYDEGQRKKIAISMLNVASRRNRFKVLSFLFEFIGLQNIPRYIINNFRQQFLLHQYVQQQETLPNLTFIDQLISIGLDPNVSDEDDTSPLLYSAQFSLSIVQHLIEKYNVHYTHVDELNSNLLHYAVKFEGFIKNDDSDEEENNNEKYNLIDYVINLDLDREQVDNYGQTPLLKASHYDFTITKYLIEKYKCNIHHQDEKGGTLLHHAICSNDTKIVQYVLNLGLDPNVRDNDGDTPLFQCVQMRRWDIVRLLIQYNADIDIPIGLDPNNNTLLLDAVANHHFRVPLLIEFGANVNICDGNGITPIMLATAMGYHDLVQMLLIQYNADITNRNIIDCTIIHCAAFSFEDNDDIMEFLIKHMLDNNLIPEYI